jgi:hypothetical protein
MRKSRLIRLPLVAALSAAAFAGPAAAQDPVTSPNGARPDVVGNPNVSHRISSYASRLPAAPTWPTDPKLITSYVSQLPGPPTWPTDPKPITEYRSTVDATDGGFDWGSAGIGAGTSIVVVTAGMAGLATVRRRRHPGPQTLASS